MATAWPGPFCEHLATLIWQSWSKHLKDKVPMDWEKVPDKTDREMAIEIKGATGVKGVVDGNAVELSAGSGATDFYQGMAGKGDTDGNEAGSGGGGLPVAGTMSTTGIRQAGASMSGSSAGEAENGASRSTTGISDASLGRAAVVSRSVPRARGPTPGRETRQKMSDNDAMRIWAGRLEDWEIYIGRGHPRFGLPRSKWANPFRVTGGNDCRKGGGQVQGVRAGFQPHAVGERVGGQGAHLPLSAG